jgi:hypothetical protein
MAALLERWLDNRGVSTADLGAVAVAALAGAPMPRAALAIATRSTGDMPTRPPAPADGGVLPAGVAEGVGSGAAPPPSSSPPGSTSPLADADAVTTPRPAGRAAPLPLAWRRVPLVAALGLAGLLLAGLLLAGSLAGLQAGVSRPGPGASVLPARPTATPTPSPSPSTAAPVQTAAPIRITSSSPRPLRVDMPPRASPPRDHQQREKE